MKTLPTTKRCRYCVQIRPIDLFRRVRKNGEARRNECDACNRKRVREHFDTVVMGHWHQLIMAPSQGLIVNGALKGLDEYAAISNFAPERPQQALWVTTPEHGVTFTAPVFVQDRAKEGW